jgi:MOSC domain-containing protein YiiM
MIAVSCVEAKPGKGLTGDRYSSRNGVREVTLIQREHLDAIAGERHLSTLDPGILRRNLVISGIDLNALMYQRFRIGAVVLEGTGPCDPCHKMNLALGPGGETAMQGRSGITARVLQGGILHVGDRIALASISTNKHPIIDAPTGRPE